MDELSFKLEIFEGPLDLLLSLIEKHKINICDIEISLLLEQYMAYIDKAREYRKQYVRKGLFQRGTT